MLAFWLLASSEADAYPWMIKHQATSCASCHVDPSGAGLLTAYGRVQTEQLVETQYGPLPEEPSKNTGPFLGLVPVPEWAQLAFSFRGGGLYTQSFNPAVTRPAPPTIRPIQMATDLRAGVQTPVFRASASLGFALRRAEAAALTPTEPGGENNLVSREHWLGAVLLDESLFVRAGRMHLPFGIRTVEHTLWVRELTRTDVNDQQQHGLSVTWAGENLRAELMGIAGNYQLQPDAYRERGYSGFVEWAPFPTAAVGVSSLVTFARSSLDRAEADAWRQAHGVFGRWGVNTQLTLLAEVDALVRSARAIDPAVGFAAWAQADWEPLRGLHGIVSLEAANAAGSGTGAGVGAWLGVSWFAVRAVELRVDAIVRRLPSSSGAAVVSVGGMGQLHLSL